MHVVVVDLGDVRVCNYNERKVAQGLDTVGQACRENGERKVG